ncbi:MAG: putative sugar nucleotidyl transferase [Nitrososphaerales archaeon]
MILDSLNLVVFESKTRRNFEPLSLTRPTFDFLIGARTLLERTEGRLNHKASALIVPKYLETICKESHPGRKINELSSGPFLAVNSLVSPRCGLLQKVQHCLADYGMNFAVVDSRKDIIFAVLEDLETGACSMPSLAKIGKKLPEKNHECSLLEFPWHLVSENEFAIEQDYGLLANDFKWKQGSVNLKGTEFLGKKILLSESAEVEPFVTLDSRKGPLIVDDGAVIQSFSRLQGPCYIGKSSIVKGARIGEGTSIGKECRVGGEVEASVMHDYSNKNHDGFLGHSIVGNWVNLGALTTNSDLKNTYGKIKANIRGKEVNSGSIKVGCFLSDMCKTSIGTLILSGKSVGVGSNVLGVVSKNVPSFTFWADSLSAERRELYIENALETQRRMMERRGVLLTPGYAQMMKSVFKLTSRERRESGVKHGKFKI